MQITLEDIAGMASPGWGGLGVEIPDLDLLDDLDGEVKDDQDSEDGYEEIGCEKAVPEEKPESERPTKKPFLHGEDGRREGLSTAEMCNHCKNRMLRKDILEQEFLAIRQIYPANGADLKILIWLAAGYSYQEVAERVGRTVRTIKNAVQRLRQFRETGKVKLLPPEAVQSGAELLEPFPKSRAGRKPKKITEKKITEKKITAITAGAIIQLDLLGDPIQLAQRKARARRQAGVRRPRVRAVRAVMPGQMELFQDFQEAA